MKKSHFLVGLPLALLLASCGSKSSAPTGQVLATVGGEEITSTDLEAELNGATAQTPEQQKELQRVGLENLINRTILAQSAKADGLDKGPQAAVLERKAKQAALIEALNAKLRKDIPLPSDEEVDNYVNSNPGLFSEHRNYLVDQLVVPKVDQALVTALKPVTSLDAAVAVLKSRNLPYSTTSGVIDTLTIGPDAAKKLASLPPGEVFIVPANPGLRINQIKSSQVSPIASDQAKRVAREMLVRQRVQGQLNAEAERRIKAGRAEVKYNPKFAPPSGKPEAGASAPAKN